MHSCEGSSFESFQEKAKWHRKCYQETTYTKTEESDEQQCRTK